VIFSYLIIYNSAAEVVDFIKKGSSRIVFYSWGSFISLTIPLSNALYQNLTDIYDLEEPHYNKSLAGYNGYLLLLRITIILYYYLMDINE
jgi:hypothetical protein